MRHRRSMTIALMGLGVVLYVCGIVAMLILPPIIRVVVGMMLAVAGGILVLVGVEFIPALPRDEED